MANAHSYEDGFNLLCGRLIGSGMTRQVFDCNIRKDVVVKVENEEIRHHFQNIVEWQVWGRVAGTPFEKWFAPVVEMSPNGRVLIMQRTTPIGESELPTHVPLFFTDLKPANWGMLNGKPVCHDYGKHLLMEQGMSTRLRKAKWHGYST